MIKKIVVNMYKTNDLELLNIKQRMIAYFKKQSNNIIENIIKLNIHVLSV